MKSWIQTYTGKRFDPLHPDPTTIDIEDIAHALSMLCRFTGHVATFYSVAEHSVRVARRVSALTGGDPYLCLWALLHDASEAYLNDISRPVKYSRALAAYRRAEVDLQAVIVQAFGLQPLQPDVVTQADNELLATEARALFRGGVRDDWGAGPGIPQRGMGWTPEQAKLRFMMEFTKWRMKNV